MKLLDLFSGIGGFSLAASWAGIETVQFVEYDKYCKKVINKNFPGVPIHEDIKTFKGQQNSADIISGGFPCQPFSVAGKRRGSEDDRALWPEMFRIIKEVRPSWVIGENVAGIVNLGLSEMLVDLETIGYDSQSFIVPACAVNAPHRRNRIWIIANTNQSRWRPGKQIISEGRRNLGNDKQPNSFDNGGTFLFDWHTKKTKRDLEIEPALYGKNDGVPKKLDEIEERLKALGNAIVPQVAYEIFKYIMQIERGRNEKQL